MAVFQICDNVLQKFLEVEYALRTSAKPIGVAEYQLLPELPENLVGQLPSPDEFKEKLGGKLDGEENF